MKIAKEIGDRAGERQAYGSLGNAYQSLADYQKAIEYHEKLLKIAKEIGDRAEEGQAYGSLGNDYPSLGYYQKAIEYHEKLLKMAKEIGDRAGEGNAYHNIGIRFFSLGQFENAADNFGCAVEACSAVRSCLNSRDDWKINFRELYETTYTALWKSLLRIAKLDEALIAAERGRAQTLTDNLLISQHKLPASLLAVAIDLKETVSPLITELSSPTLFLALDGLTINIWLPSRGKKVIFRKGRLEGDRRDKYPVRALLQSCLEKIGTDFRVRELIGDNLLKPFYDAIIGPIAEFPRPQDDEMVIVPDGALRFFLHGPQLFNRLEFALFHLLQVIN